MLETDRKRRKMIEDYIEEKAVRVKIRPEAPKFNRADYTSDSEKEEDKPQEPELCLPEPTLVKLSKPQMKKLKRTMSRQLRQAEKQKKMLY
jgi:hypothetical protein